MGVVEYPLASPLPTSPPHPRDVNRRLHIARDEVPDTCAFIDAQSTNSLTCDAGSLCYEVYRFTNQFCCDLNDYSLNACGLGPTTCFDSTQVAGLCNSDCLANTANVICTEGIDTYCQLTTYEYNGGLTGWDCGPEPTELTAYHFFTDDSGFSSSVTDPFVVFTSSFPISTSSALSSSAPTSSASSSLVNPSPGPIVSNSTPAPASSGLSTGAKAGIAVGAIAAVAIIAALIAFIFIQKRRSDQRRQQAPPSNFNPNQPQMAQQQQQPQAIAPVPPSPALTQQNHLSMASTPSATSATPLTQANMRAMTQSPPPASEVLPSESASQINSPVGTTSVLSGPASPTGYNPSSSNAGSQEQSGLGALPNYPTGASAFPHGGPAGAQSVLSNPNTFISSPAVHAPGPYSQGPNGE